MPATRIQFKRGKKSELPTSAPSGTPLWCEDSHELYIGTDVGIVPAVNAKARNIGEIVISSIPLYDAGLHLLDGSTIYGDGIYADFVNYMKYIYESGGKTQTITRYYGWKFTLGIVPSTSTTVYTKSLNPSEIDQLYDANGSPLMGWIINSINGSTMITKASGYTNTATFVYDSSLNIVQNITIPSSCFMKSSSYHDATLVGRLDENDYVISGFDTNKSYIQMPVKTPTSSFELVVKTHTPMSFSNYSVIETDTKFYGLIWRVASGGNSVIYMSSTGKANNICNGTKPGLTIPANMDVWFKVTWNGSTYSFAYSTDGVNYTTGTTVANSNPINWSTGIQGLGGGSWESYPWTNGTIDLKGSYLKIDGVTYWNPVHYLNEEESWNRCVALHGECGKFLYNPVNHSVRLPKINGFIECTHDENILGDLIEAGLPNITGCVPGSEEGQMKGVSYKCPDGAFYTKNTNATNGSSANDSYDNDVFGFDASLSNPIYGRSNKVQPESIMKLAYIVLADTHRTDIEVNLNYYATEVNRKCNADLSNCTAVHIVDNYKSNGYWRIIYSNGYCRQGGVIKADVDTYQSGKQLYLPQPYANTDYFFCVQSVRGAGANIYEPVIYNKEKTFLYYHNVVANGNGATWLAEGYIR